MTKTIFLLCAIAIFSFASIGSAQTGYLGFDKNDYPGDEAMVKLRKTFRYTSYWLNNPPGLKRNPWVGKRPVIKQQGFGFLVLFNGRLSDQLKGKNAAALGRFDGNTAVDSALREGFPKNVRIFLDQEQGGRLLRDQAAYVLSWVDAVRDRGARAGVYCSGIDVPDGSGKINTAENIEQLEKAEKSREAPNPDLTLKLWVANDQCPPAPGCTETDLQPSEGARLSNSSLIAVWQYAQSPRRGQYSSTCPKNAAPDGNCYAPGLPRSRASLIDLDVSSSADPSEAP
jgi:Domain of unknown function (DUF1906)